MTQNNKEFNKLCETCCKECKQAPKVVLISCPNYKKKPKQLEFKFKFKKLNGKEN